MEVSWFKSHKAFDLIEESKLIINSQWPSVQAFNGKMKKCCDYHWIESLKKYIAAVTYKWQSRSFTQRYSYNLNCVLSLHYFKVTETDIRNFSRRKCSRSLVENKNFGLIWEVVAKLEYWYFVERCKMPISSLTQWGEVLWMTNIFGNFVKKP